jgi:hypothetical protein
MIVIRRMIVIRIMRTIKRMIVIRRMRTIRRMKTSAIELCLEHHGKPMYHQLSISEN